MLVLIAVLTSLLRIVYCGEMCRDMSFLATTNVGNEGFHRDIKWLIEIGTENLNILRISGCSIAIKQGIPSGLYVNPDQIADLVRVGKIYATVLGKIDIESPMHQADPHVVYIFNNNSLDEKISLELPVHLRYQRSQITGGYGKVELPPFSLLVKCRNSLQFCGHYMKIEAPCTYISKHTCNWSNVSYQDITNGIKMLVPIGDLDHYPLVSIITLLVACSGCIYILSVLSTTVL